MVSIINKAIDKMVSLIEFVCSVLFISICLIVLIQVIGRFVLKIATPWSEELARYLLVILVFLGATVSVKERSHLVALNIFEGRSEKTKLFGSLVVDGIILLVSVMYARNSIRMSRIVGTEMASSMLWLKTRYLYIIISIGFLLSSLFAVFLILKTIITFKERNK
ncbi:TRAP transporter small permease subunit [Marispirochaeta aestuarii]|uniref:TRAP transporter small permease n=1 Tax=Marispirochaeta aestuarii TaxID=1963862 RepID=UPI0029C8D6A7|nr:TRAP transporter small permease subunit [Marispirochaeta aestuarii]